eukprot:gnl/TRDRNA2_/TRDRNA2_39737_c0_seq1.p1 gnl/TRDRNA2_/TRDRNA2_39737_c0~~gnl/TRDRNA2_/TRDRNA2_39737_c0_seq1.p1  ORF type:complete len:258 (-),score=48.86 gnl/TRDRNA2_/TRDRNA2_39737_c0_seq1:16-690(-)
MCHVGTQTDPVTVRCPDASAGSTQTWSTSDDANQMEAIRMIQLLGKRGTAQDGGARRAADTEDLIRREREACKELGTSISQEISRTQAAQQQVLCLEAEMDAKESCIQATERALERKSADVDCLQRQLRILHEGRAARRGSQSEVPNASEEVLKQQLAEHNRRLEMKDQHIVRLINVLRQHHPGICPEELLNGQEMPAVRTDGVLSSALPGSSSNVRSMPGNRG